MKKQHDCSPIDLWVVIPFFNEEKLIFDTLNSLFQQSDINFKLVCVNNNSTDSSADIIRSFHNEHPDIELHLIFESQKGTGAASDTGFRYAIANGATHVARTDADSICSHKWIELIKKDFSDGYLFIGGRIAPRDDEDNFSIIDRIFAPIVIRIFEQAPRFFFHHPKHNYPMFMIAGLNMAIESKLYLQVDGFPRSAIDDTDEDRELHDKVCKTITGNKAKLNKKAIVYGSMRKVKHMGYIGILLWYWDRKRIPEVIDVR